jgi:hypothetical protein
MSLRASIAATKALKRADLKTVGLTGRKPA